ncbi:MAG: CopG family antitoxin [Patescibacteria group bacterium]
MKIFELDDEEKELETAIAVGEFESVPNLEQEKKRYQEIARATLQKRRNINIRISERDLQALKARAAAKGLPYQTLVSSVLHQYSNGKVKELA